MIYSVVLVILVLSVVIIRNAYRRLGCDWFDGNILIVVFLLLYFLIPSLGALTFGAIPLRSGVSYSLQANTNILILVLSILIGIYVSLEMKAGERKPSNEIILRNLKSFSFVRSLGLFMVCVTTVVLIKYQFGFYKVESYNQSYRIAANMGTLARQLLIMLQFFAEFCGVAVLVIYLRNKSNIRLVFLMLIVYIIVSDKSAARTSLFAPILLFMLSYNYLVRRFKLVQIVPIMIVSLASFVTLGYLRAGLGLAGLDLNSFVYIGEFVNIWTNSLHLYTLEVNQDVILPWQVFLNEFVAFLPDQIVPWRKLSYPYWYMETFYSEQLRQGSGLGFGIVSQVLLTGGFIGGVIRGFLLSQLLIKLKYKVYEGDWYWFVIYIIVISKINTAIRTESLQIFTSSLIKIILIIIILNLPLWRRQKL